MEMRERILDMLEELTGDEVVKEDPDINLLEEDLIDSMDYVELLLDIQDEFGVVIAPSEVTREEMDTPNKIISVIASRQ